MKKTIRASMALLILLAFAGSAWALSVYNPNLTYAGDVDQYIDATTRDGLPGNGNDPINELAWINQVLSDPTKSYYNPSAPFDLSDYTQIDTGFTVYRTYNDPAPATENTSLAIDSTFALYFGTAIPEYFLIKTGNLDNNIPEGEDTPTDLRYFLFANNEELANWGVFQLQGYDLIGITAISHYGTVDGAPVPEPATLLLLGSGLLGLAGFRRKSE